jgi:2-dehydro-3-deoxy-D-arabinonate dehydratase
MPLCLFSTSRGTLPRLGWVDNGERRSVVSLASTIADLLRLEHAERIGRLAPLLHASELRLPLAAIRLHAPVDTQEVWAAGVTYERSRVARMEESTQQDVYDRVYNAERPEVFFKAPAWRCVGPDDEIGIRHDSSWDVPEPELAIVIDARGQIAGYTIGNDVSSRSIEGENPLYLPQAKLFTASAALGPWIVLPEELDDPLSLGIRMRIERDGRLFWTGEASTSQLRRTLSELIDCLYAALEFPEGAVLMTGTCIVPPSEFTLAPGDVVTVEIDAIGTLSNRVRRLEPRPA